MNNQPLHNNIIHLYCSFDYYLVQCVIAQRIIQSILNIGYLWAMWGLCSLQILCNYVGK